MGVCTHVRGVVRDTAGCLHAGCRVCVHTHGRVYTHTHTHTHTLQGACTLGDRPLLHSAAHDRARVCRRRTRYAVVVNLVHSLCTRVTICVVAFVWFFAEHVHFWGMALGDRLCKRLPDSDWQPMHYRYAGAVRVCVFSCVYLRVRICACALARGRVRACVPSPRQRVSRPPSCTPRVHARTRLECVKNTPPLVPASKSAARLHAVDRQQIHVENLRIYVHMS